jgi:hypothetical protein
VTVTNNGTAGLTISELGVGVYGANAGNFSITANNCSGATVAVNASCLVSVTFTPSVTGAEAASLQFTDNAAGSPQSVGLTGTGTDFAIGLAPGASATATVSAGNSATYNLQVTPISGFTGTIALSCTGAPAESTCTPSQASATLNGNTATTFSVEVTTTVPSTASAGVGGRWRPFDRLRILPMAFVVAFASTLLAFASRFRGAAARRRRACAYAISLALLLLASALLGACGGGSGGTGMANPATPTETYFLTVTGTSNGVSHSQSLTLTVN